MNSNDPRKKVDAAEILKKLGLSAVWTTKTASSVEKLKTP